MQQAEKIIVILLFRLTKRINLYGYKIIVSRKSKQWKN